MNKNEINNSPVFVYTRNAFTQIEIAINVTSIVSYNEVNNPGVYNLVEVKLDNGDKYLIIDKFREFDLKVKEALAAVRREIIEKRNY